MNPIAYFVALWPRLMTAGYSHPFGKMHRSSLDATSYQQGVMDTLRACPPPGVVSVVAQRWAYRQLGGWTCESTTDLWIRPPS